MSLSIEWFWEWLQNAVSTIASWLSSLWDTAKQIENTGQGLFSGLVAVASGLWDAIRWFADQIYSGLKWFYDGLKAVGDAVYGFGQWLYNALSGIPGAIYSFGQWIWSGMLWVANTVSSAIASAINTLLEGIEWIWNQLAGMVQSVADAVNKWWTDTMIFMRRKLKQTLMADITIYMTWKAVEKAVERGDFKSVLMMPLLGIAGVIGGGIFAEIIDSFIPVPSTQTFPLVPTITLGEIKLPRISAPQTPTPSTPILMKEYYVSISLPSIEPEVASSPPQGIYLQLPSIEPEISAPSSHGVVLQLPEIVAETVSSSQPQEISMQLPSINAEAVLTSKSSSSYLEAPVIEAEAYISSLVHRAELQVPDIEVEETSVQNQSQ